MIDHLSIGVTQFERAKDFYDAVMATLGARRVMEHGEAAGYGESSGKPAFWIAVPEEGAPTPQPGCHIAFAARNRAAVDAFHTVAILFGAKDNGAPGLRPHYHEHYYASFIIDRDGNHLEAVCHKPA